MTENRGAYINIGSDYKLKFNQFDAVPHPNIRPMVCDFILQQVVWARTSQCFSANTMILGIRKQLDDVVTDMMIFK